MSDSGVVIGPTMSIAMVLNGYGLEMIPGSFPSRLATSLTFKQVKHSCTTLSVFDLRPSISLNPFKFLSVL